MPWALSLLLVAAVASAAPLDEAPDWQTDPSVALRLARATERPLLVYVCPEPQGCPAARHMDGALCAPDAVEQLAEVSVPLRLYSDRLESAEAQRFLASLGVALQPALVVVSADGEVLHRQYAGLYPAFDEQGRVMPGGWGAMLTPEDVQRLLIQVLERRKVLIERERSLRERAARSATAELIAERAVVLEDLGRRDEAIALLRSAPSEARDPVRHPTLAATLAGLLARAARHAEAALQYEMLAATTGAAEVDPGIEVKPASAAQREAWRLEAAHLRLKGVPAQPEGVAVAHVARARAQLEDLAARAAEERVRLRARLSLAERLRLEGEAAAREHVEALSAAAGKGPTAPEAWTASMLFRLAGLEAMPGPGAARAEAHYRMLMATYPDSFEAQQIKHAMLGMLRMMAEQPMPPEPPR